MGLCFLDFKNDREVAVIVAVRKIYKRQQLEIKEFYLLSMYLPHLHNSAKKFPSSVRRILFAKYLQLLGAKRGVKKLVKQMKDIIGSASKSQS